MSLMVSPISNVSFRAQETVQPNVEDILSRPGIFAKPETTINQPSKKKHSFLKAVAGILITAGVIAGALYILPKQFGNVFKETKNIKDIESLTEKIQAYITTGVYKGGEYIDKWASNIVKLFKNEAKTV